MIINKSTLHDLFVSFNLAFQNGLGKAEKQYDKIAMIVPSTGSETKYAWLGNFPAMREWLGDRIVGNFAAHSYTIVNKNFESTVTVSRDDVEDDKVGIYKPMFEMLGDEAAVHPDKLIFEIVRNGHELPCYDRLPFFSDAHPVIVDGKDATASNNLAPESKPGTPWYLFCTRRPMKPFIFQKRRDYTLVRMDSPNDENVFMRNEFLYGVDGRVNVGFGLWQMAVRSTHPLNAANYAAARAAMASLKSENGTPLGILPDTLLVPTALESDALTLLNCELVNGSSNPWHGSASLLVSPWL